MSASYSVVTIILSRLWSISGNLSPLVWISASIIITFSCSGYILLLLVCFLPYFPPISRPPKQSAIYILPWSRFVCIIYMDQLCPSHSQHTITIYQRLYCSIIDHFPAYPQSLLITAAAREEEEPVRIECCIWHFPFLARDFYGWIRGRSLERRHFPSDLFIVLGLQLQKIIDNPIEATITSWVDNWRRGKLECIFEQLLLEIAQICPKGDWNWIDLIIILYYIVYHFIKVKEAQIKWG